MGKLKKNIVFILDFDGVLFDTSLESFYVMNETERKGSVSKETIINQKKYSKFIELRPFVTSAWQYYWVNKYTELNEDESNYEYYTTEKLFDKNKEAEEFEKDFLLNRKALSEKNYFNKPVSAPYKFWNMIMPLIELHPERFLILSTKDEESILNTINTSVKDFSFDKTRLFSKSHFKKEGENKHNVFLKYIKGIYSDDFIFVEDSHIHIKEFYNEKSVKCIRALWGYVPKNLKKSNSQLDAYKKIIKEF
tara:strand:+ start:226 stop:975 length:750 start_codon:yes stop_codon:yes gene_type:complete